ncbi:MAG: hypothetical protein JSC161_000794 [Candidatus Tokpelaia sp. JSC161]|jgi:hypothetical protein|nr:MAG: hypothetical protein JSC161_000794 [Candidatus Tokpelaia sp. JSC161]
MKYINSLFSLVLVISLTGACVNAAYAANADSVAKHVSKHVYKKAETASKKLLHKVHKKQKIRHSTSNQEEKNSSFKK